MKIAIGFCAALIGVGAILVTENYFGADINLIRDEPISATNDVTDEDIIGIRSYETNNFETSKPTIVLPKQNSKGFTPKRLNANERDELAKKIEKSNIAAKRRYKLIKSGELARYDSHNQPQQK